MLAEQTPMTWRPRATIALVLGVSLLNMLVSRIVRALAGGGAPPLTVSLSLLATFVALYVVELGTVAIVFRRLGVRMRDALGLRAVAIPWRWIPIALVSAFAVRVVATAYAGIMLGAGLRLPGWNTDPTRFFPRDLLGTLVLVFVVVIAAPIAEEVVFRGVLLRTLVPRVGEGWAIALTSIVFAALHLNVFSFLPIAAVAYVLALLYLRSNSLWVSIAGHSAFNALGIVVVLLLRVKGGL